MAAPVRSGDYRCTFDNHTDVAHRTKTIIAARERIRSAAPHKSDPCDAKANNNPTRQRAGVCTECESRLRE